MKLVLTALATMTAAVAINCTQPPQHPSLVAPVLEEPGFLTPLGASSPTSGKESEMLLDGIYHPSGYMGDAIDGALRMSIEDGHGIRDKVPYNRIEYRPAAGKRGWAAVGWQNPANNWGTEKGRDLSRRHFRALEFEAKGLHGSERVVFKALGGTPGDAAFPASNAEISLGAVTLESDWKTYRIEFPENDGAGNGLSNVPTALTFAVSSDMDPDGAVFYIASPRFVP